LKKRSLFRELLEAPEHIDAAGNTHDSFIYKAIHRGSLTYRRHLTVGESKAGENIIWIAGSISLLFWDIISEFFSLCLAWILRQGKT
jgi:hypothetical protein